MLNRIRIRGYKSLTGVDVKLEPLSVLFGPNGSGKSNFLDALQLLSRMSASRTLKEAFDPPYRGTPLESFTFGPGGMAGLLEKENLTFSIQADVELSPAVVRSVNRQIREMKGGKTQDESGPDGSGARGSGFIFWKRLRYRLEVRALARSGVLRVEDEYLAALNRQWEPVSRPMPFVERHEAGRIHVRMEGQGHPAYYERGLDHTILSRPLYPPHYAHVVAMRQELASWLFFYFEPRERMRALNPVKEVRHIGLMGEELASFLNTLRALDEPQFKAVEKALHMIIPSVTGIDVQVNNLGQVELRLLEDGTPVPASVVSEGTLRILGLLALRGVKEPPALIGFEEPENGIHPRRIRMIAELLKTPAAIADTQLIVTTHSPILPDLIPDESLYVCRKEDGRTVIEPFSAWGPIARRAEIDTALDSEEASLPVSQRILRGDFDV
ncbi:MAG: AAA family ATPase [Acidobacteriota bacterium]